MKTKEFNSLSTATTLSTPAASEPETTPIRLWLVDDNERIRNMLAELLAKNDGIECTCSFGSASAALSALASKAGPDVVLLDINMGQENGLDAVRPIRSLSRSTRVLMFTTFFDSQAKSRALEDGASGFLLKHYPLDQILQSIRQARLNPEPPRNRRRSSCFDSNTSSPSSQSSGKDGLAGKSWRERIRNIWN
jgi:DNA-binding NarL/FixJ family response regulator